LVSSWNIKREVIKNGDTLMEGLFMSICIPAKTFGHRLLDLSFGMPRLPSNNSSMRYSGMAGGYRGNSVWLKKPALHDFSS
jgi:hypothetical protein